MWWQLIAGAATIAADILLDNDNDNDYDNDYDYENEQEQKQKARNQLRQERTSINDFANDFDIYANGSDMLSYRQITDVKRKKIEYWVHLTSDEEIFDPLFKSENRGVSYFLGTLRLPTGIRIMSIIVGG
jgi:hypothetical protein